MSETSNRWAALYEQVPLCNVAHHFAGIAQSPFLLEYLTRVLELCPRGAKSLETGVGSGYGAIWLSLRGVDASGIDYAPGIVERARQVNNLLGGAAGFETGDLFELYAPGRARYSVIHHQGVLEHFTVPAIRAALAQQVAMAEYVVFSVPSVYYPFEPEFGDERLLPVEEWERIVSPFHLEEIRYYGDPALGGREHVLCVLRGQPVTPELEAMMRVAARPYLPGITAIVHTRNEAANIADCLATLKFADQIVVCDMESTDNTVEIALAHGAEVMSHPYIQEFDRARNASAMRARYSNTLFVDSDERMHPRMGAEFCRLAALDDPGFDGMMVPFHHMFAGHPMACLYPGYTAPRFLRTGSFVFNSRLHSGARVDGPIARFPADDPSLAVVHHSFPTIADWVLKMNRYTDGESESMLKDGLTYNWRASLRHMMEDLTGYYDRGGAHRDGVHGFIYAFSSGFYRFMQHSKLHEKRFKAGALTAPETAAPESVREMLTTMLACLDEKPVPRTAPVRVALPVAEPSAGADAQRDMASVVDSEPADLVWSGPLRDPSGYGEESRAVLLAARLAGVNAAAHVIPWSSDLAEPGAEDAALLARMEEREAKPGFTHVVHNFAPGFFRHPEAGVSIGYTLFETDRLPEEWVAACNRMDYVWTPTEFNRRTFEAADGLGMSLLYDAPGIGAAGALWFSQANSTLEPLGQAFLLLRGGTTTA